MCGGKCGFREGGLDVSLEGLPCIKQMFNQVWSRFDLSAWFRGGAEAGWERLLCLQPGVQHLPGLLPAGTAPLLPQLSVFLSHLRLLVAV